MDNLDELDKKKKWTNWTDWTGWTDWTNWKRIKESGRGTGTHAGTIWKHFGVLGVVGVVFFEEKKSLAATYSPTLLRAVPLAMRGLTSEFGMGSGISLSLLPPSKLGL